MSKKKTSTVIKHQHKLKLGRVGEKQALNYLQQHDYQLIKKNYQHPPDQIDLIMLDCQRQEIVFVEVKTRSQEFSGESAQLYSQRQLQAQIRVAEFFLASYQSQKDYRFDLIIITPQNLHHFENLTWP